MVNLVILVGRLGRDPEIKFLEGGRALCRFRIATEESYRDRDGNRKKITEWHNVQAWGSVGESIAKYSAKGAMLYLQGQLKTRSYQRDGVTHYATDVNCKFVRFLTGPAAGAEHGTATDLPPEPPVDDDIPF